MTESAANIWLVCISLDNKFARVKLMVKLIASVAYIEVDSRPYSDIATQVICTFCYVEKMQSNKIKKVQVWLHYTLNSKRLFYRDKIEKYIKWDYNVYDIFRLS